MNQNRERRSQRRIPASPRASVRIASGNARGEGQLLDVNNAGAFVATGLRLSVGAQLGLELQFDDESSPSIPARVIRVSPPGGKVDPGSPGSREPGGVGVVFLPETVRERAFIQRAVLAALTEDLDETADPERSLAAHGMG